MSRFLLRALCVACLCLAGAPTFVCAADTVAAPSVQHEFTWELDPYYTDVGVELPLDNRPVPDGGAMRETFSSCAAVPDNER